ncbi:uncharacterized protein LOC62_07G009584 [Vanrija pseudolonga]|uniref:Uncharacterized protein n=1 Tax=Vanrija pseudolonga TaxID=143232 RepID=A0AAF0YG19_9TREE|nr:hypothetical protein LOC62_07G009584 [Vanrija pseudolonga]
MAAAVAKPAPPATVTLSAAAYPHLIESILSNSERPVLIAFRSTSRQYLNKVDAILARHIVISAPVELETTDLIITAKRGPRLPTFIGIDEDLHHPLPGAKPALPPPPPAASPWDGPAALVDGIKLSDDEEPVPNVRPTDPPDRKRCKKLLSLARIIDLVGPLPVCNLNAAALSFRHPHTVRLLPDQHGEYASTMVIRRTERLVLTAGVILPRKDVALSGLPPSKGHEYDHYRHLTLGAGAGGLSVATQPMRLVGLDGGVKRIVVNARYAPGSFHDPALFIERLIRLSPQTNRPGEIVYFASSDNTGADLPAKTYLSYLDRFTILINLAVYAVNHKVKFTIVGLESVLPAWIGLSAGANVEQSVRDSVKRELRQLYDLPLSYGTGTWEVALGSDLESALGAFAVSSLKCWAATVTPETFDIELGL